MHGETYRLNLYSPYGIQESLEGFKRAAATHGWAVSSCIVYGFIPSDFAMILGPRGLGPISSLVNR